MLPLNAAQIPAMFNRALGLVRAGKPDEALALFKQLATLAPKRAEIPFQIAQIHMKNGAHQAGFEQFAKAAMLAPAEPAVWRGYASALASYGSDKQKTAAKAQLKHAKLDARIRKEIARSIDASQRQSRRVSKNTTANEAQAIVAMINEGQFDSAETTARNLIAERGPSEILLMLHGAALAKLGRAAEAEDALKAALKIDPDYGEAVIELGQLLLALNRRQEAKEHLLHAQRLLPKNPIMLGNLGKLYNETGDPRRALECFDALLMQDPDNHPALMIRAQAHISLEDAEQARTDLDRLHALVPETGETKALVAVTEKLGGQDSAAQATAKAALELAPDNLRVITIAANLLQQSGAFDEADKLLRDAVSRGVKSGALYRMIAQGKKISADDPIIADMQALWEQKTLPDEARMDLGYGLVKVLEDAKDYDRAWAYLDRSNSIMRAQHPFDAQKPQRDFDRFSAFLKGFDLSRVGSVGQKDDRTIFVTGLPRSGTTLVEQILASHSTVTGGDELGLFHPMGFDQVAKTAASGGHINDMTDAQLKELGQAYQAEIDKRVPGAERITDKSISTYQIAPLVWLALPNAKIVALRRDPRDNLWSMLKNRFVAGLHLYTYSQKDLVETYRLYTEYLALWRDMAADRIYEIEYEALVSDPERETRKLLAFCELDWEDACLDFHKTERDVKTLSLAQVRQPLYNSSIGKWRRYEAHLGEMLEGLKGLDGVPDN